MQRRWFKGDTHLHTLGSVDDGVHHQYELIEKAKKAGLDWMIITDHNFNSLEKSYSSDGLTVIQGQEVTGHNGHVNVWGAKVAYDPPYDLSDIDAYKKIMKASKENGATVSVNHPFCSMCPFRMDIDDFPMDCVEVWNTIQHSDNIKNMDWWVGKLNAGIKIGAVGGSDFHRNHAGIDLFAMPTTITHAKSNSPEDILEALREGRSVVTNRPDTSMIYLKVEDAELGDTITLESGLTGTCEVTKLLPGHTLKIFNNDKVIYQHTASGYEKRHEAVFGVKEKGYIRAQIDYVYPAPVKKLYTFVEKKILHGSGVVPPFFWAFTNPIWID